MKCLVIKATPAPLLTLTSLPQFLLHQSRQLRQISLRRILPRQPLRPHRHQFQLLSKLFHRTQPISRWLHRHQLLTSQFQSSNLPQRQLHLLRQHRLRLQRQHRSLRHLLLHRSQHLSHRLLHQPQLQHLHLRHNQKQHQLRLLHKPKVANALFSRLIPTSTTLPPAQSYRAKWTNC